MCGGDGGGGGCSAWGERAAYTTKIKNTTADLPRQVPKSGILFETDYGTYIES